MEQKTYDAVIKLNAFHEVPMQGVTRDELKLLAFIHGADAVPAKEIRFKGMKTICEARRDDNGHEAMIEVKTEQDEYRRLARKYDMLSEFAGSARGRRLVEECFKVRLDDFDDNIFEQIDPVQAAEQAMVAAEMKAVETQRVIVEEAPPAKPVEAVKPTPSASASALADAFSRR